MIRRFAGYFKPYRLVFWLDLAAALAVSVCNLIFPLFTRKMLNEFIPDKNLKWLIIFAVGLLAFYLIKVALNYFMCCQGHIMGAKIQADMRRALFDKIERLPISYFDDHKTGELMSRMSTDLFEVSELAHHGPEDLFISIAQFVGAFVILLFINPILTLISFSVIPFIIFIVMRARRGMSRASHASRREIAELNASVENSISGVRVTKAFNAQEREASLFDSSNGGYVEARRGFCHAMGVFFSWLSFGTDFLSLLVLAVGGVIIVTTGSIDYVDLVTFMLYVSVFIQPITKMGTFIEQYENGMTGFRRFCEVMDAEEEVDEPGAVEAPAFRGDIAFEGVHFSYNTSREVLRDMSFSVHAGTTLALVGSSGGGKTTVCRLLPRFYETSAGCIKIDGQDIRSFTRASLRENIGMVQQDVFLFNATIYDNIAYGAKNATREEVIRAAERAELDEFIRGLPQGYDTPVGERGVKLSGGQKQRIAIARVFLKNPPILILDEATSALDNITEHEIQKSLSELTRGRTTIVVAHRLSTVRGADEIMYIEGGKILERGTHDTLLRAGGEYAKLVRVNAEL